MHLKKKSEIKIDFLCILFFFKFLWFLLFFSQKFIRDTFSLNAVQIQAEFRRISEGKDMKQMLQNGLKQYSRRLVRLGVQSKKADDFFKKKVQEVGEARDELERDGEIAYQL